jgi:small-conductance mechanosensitive channel
MLTKVYYPSGTRRRTVRAHGDAGAPMKIRHIPLLVLTAGLPWIARGAKPICAQAQQSEALAAAAEQPTAPVTVDGVPLFSVRGISSYPAERRAQEIADRIVALAADRSVPAESVAVRETPLGTSLVAPGQRVMVLTDADAELEGLSRPILAEAYRRRISQAIQDFRRDREPSLLWRRAGVALVATLLLVMVLGIGLRLLRWFGATVERRYRSRIPDVHFHSITVVQGDQLWRAVRRVIVMIGAVFGLIVIYTYLSYVLVLFPWSRALGHNLSAILLQPLTTIATGAIGYVPNLVFLLIIALLTYYVLAFSRLLFRHVREGTVVFPNFDPDWAAPVDRIVRLLVIVFALVIAYPHIPGSGSEAFKGISILLGLLFSIGSPSVIGNLVAGQSLAFRRAFKLGDRIRIGDYVGEVAQIRLLTTYLRSPKNEQIVIPNALILNREVENLSTLAQDPGLILHTTVGIGYETPWRQVEGMLLEAAARTPGIRQQPEPFVLLKSLGDFAVVYEINVYTDTPSILMSLYSALHRNVLDVFNQYGVQIMTPAYEGDPEQPKIVPREQWFISPARPADFPALGKNAPPGDGMSSAAEPVVAGPNRP